MSQKAPARPANPDGGHAAQGWRELLPPLVTEELEAAREPRWPLWVVVTLLTVVYALLPAGLRAGPPWLMPAVCLPLLAAAGWAHRARRPRENNALGVTLTAVLTAFLVYSVVVLVEALLTRHGGGAGEGGRVLLGSAAVLWVSNCLVFSLWYWRLDAGGPHLRDLHRAGKRAMRRARDAASQDADGDGKPDGPDPATMPRLSEVLPHGHGHAGGHPRAAFLFPQMAMDDGLRRAVGEDDWTPSYIDYLFLAFNTSTALSPTDTAVLSPWAKLFMMAQSAVSLTILALLAARAVNILPSGGG